MHGAEHSLGVAQQIQRLAPGDLAAGAAAEDRFESVDRLAERLVREGGVLEILREVGAARADAAHEAVAHVHPVGVAGGDDAEGGAEAGVLDQFVEDVFAAHGVEEEVVQFLLLVWDEGGGDVVDLPDQALL